MSETPVRPQRLAKPSTDSSRTGATLRKRALGVVGLFVMGALGLVWAWWSYPLLDLRKEHLPAVHLYAGSAEIAALQGTARRSQIWVPLGEIPQPVVHAVLAAEDRRFFHHPGIDVRAVLRATVTNLRRGGVRQGGSTITQQLARMLFFSNDRTWGRKLRESGAALMLETQYSKRQILEAYLNAVYMGHDGDVAIHGVGAASRHFLGKEPAEVRLDEAALLAAAIQAPNRTFLGHFPRAVQARRNRILQAMRDLGTAGETAVREAMVRPLPRPPAGSAAQEAYFVDLVREEIARRVSLPASGEVRIATTLDPARQPGSLFKPIVYLAAFEAERAGRGPRLTPASLVLDDPIAIPVGSSTWLPQNFDHRFRGPVTVRTTLEASLNVPAVRVAQDVGLEEVVQIAQALGIARPLAAVPSLALGTSEVTLLEITAAYATLANGGVRALPTTLAAESAPQGALAVEPIRPPVRVVSAESVFLINHLLRGVMRHGTGRASARWGLSDVSAGKTGTTGSLRDAWFVGYTPDLVVGVWVGLDDASPVGLTGAQAALPIWAAVMQAAVRRSPPGEFTRPPGTLMASVDSATGRLASVGCGGGPMIEEAFRAGSEPAVSDCDGSPEGGPAESVAGGF